MFTFFVAGVTAIVHSLTFHKKRQLCSAGLTRTWEVPRLNRIPKRHGSDSYTTLSLPFHSSRGTQTVALRTTAIYFFFYHDEFSFQRPLASRTSMWIIGLIHYSIQEVWLPFCSNSSTFWKYLTTLAISCTPQSPFMQSRWATLWATMIMQTAAVMCRCQFSEMALQHQCCLAVSLEAVPSRSQSIHMELP